MQSIRSSLDSYLKYAKRAAEICRMPDGPYMYEEAIASDIRQLEEMMEDQLMSDFLDDPE